MRKVSRITLVMFSLTVSSPVLACSIVVPEDYDGSAKQMRDVRDAIRQAPTIIDGEVIRTFSSYRGENALVRVYHRLKGEVGDVVEVAGDGGGDCSIALDQIGQRSRMILSGGPKVYTLYRDQSEARIEDRFLKSDRRKVWPYLSGRAPNDK